MARIKQTAILVIPIYENFNENPFCPQPHTLLSVTMPNAFQMACIYEFNYHHY